MFQNISTTWTWSWSSFSWWSWQLLLSTTDSGLQNNYWWYTYIYIYIYIKNMSYIYYSLTINWNLETETPTIFAAKTAIHMFVYFLFCNVHLGQCDSEWAVQVRLWWGLALEFLWCDNCCFATWSAMKLRGPITCDLSASTHFLVCLIGSLRRSPVQHIHQKEMLSSEMH